MYGGGRAKTARSLGERAAIARGGFQIPSEIRVFPRWHVPCTKALAIILYVPAGMPRGNHKSTNQRKRVMYEANVSGMRNCHGSVFEREQPPGATGQRRW